MERIPPNREWQTHWTHEWWESFSTFERQIEREQLQNTREGNQKEFPFSVASNPKKKKWIHSRTRSHSFASADKGCRRCLFDCGQKVSAKRKQTKKISLCEVSLVGSWFSDSVLYLAVKKENLVLWVALSTNSCSLSSKRETFSVTSTSRKIGEFFRQKLTSTLLVHQES